MLRTSLLLPKRVRAIEWCSYLLQNDVVDFHPATKFSVLEFLVSHCFDICGVFGAAVLFGLAIDVVLLRLKRPRPWRLKLVGIFALAACYKLLHILKGTPGGVDTTPQPIDPDTLVDLHVSPVARLTAGWDSTGTDPRWPVAETLAEIAEAAYQAPVFAAEDFSRLGLTRTESLVSASMVGYVAASDEVAVVVFRGTDFSERSDWGVNKHIRTRSTDHGEIHGGFYGAYLDLDSQLRQVLSNLGVKRIWITGHSLGGALAKVCAFQLDQLAEYEIAGLVTFGQPMIAKRNLADHLDARLRGRYAWFVNGHDIVPKTPDGYEAAGRLVWMHFDGSIHRWDRAPVLCGSSPSGTSTSQSLTMGPLPPLTVRESQQLRRRVKKTAPLVFEEQTMACQSAAPEIDDHLMGAYRLHLDLLLRNAG